jgi:hypothetical protein
VFFGFVSVMSGIGRGHKFRKNSESDVSLAFMKPTSNFVFLPKSLCALTIALALGGCFRNNGEEGDFLTSKEATASFFSGDWRVGSYRVDGDDQTNGHFNEFFNFNPDHTVNVNNVTTKIIGGRWWVNSEPGNAKHPARDLQLSFDFKKVYDLELLNGDWTIVSRTPDRILLHKTGRHATDMSLAKVK